MGMRQRQTKKTYPPAKHTFKKRLAKSGYNEDTSDKIWKWYHPYGKNKTTIKE